MSRGSQGRLATAALALAALLGPPASGAAGPPPAPLDLRVLGGADAWHADNVFRVDWENPAGVAIAATRYRALDSGGATVLDGGVPWATDAFDRLHLPGPPGRYTLRIWLESAVGETVAAGSTQLRFDDARPGDVEPLLPPGWIGADDQPLLRVSHPPAPLPVSGIRGYAISLDAVPTASPCERDDRCSDAETDLRTGIDGDRLRLGRLGEGVAYVHAVAVSNSGMRSTGSGTAVLRVDATAPTVQLGNVPAGWARGPVEVGATAADWLSGMAPSGASGPQTALVVDGGVPTASPGPQARATVSGDGVHSVDCFARDLAGNVGACTAAASVRIDRQPPRLAFANALDPGDPELLRARAVDALSGLDAGGGSIAIRPARSHRQFSPLPTVILGGDLLARWRSDEYPPGEYELRATAVDLAGNEASTLRRANGTAMVLAGPLKAASSLLTGFGGRRLVWHRCRRARGGRRCQRQVVEALRRRPLRRRVPYGRGIAFAGVLSDGRGEPLGGAEVQVIEEFDGASGLRRRLTTVATDGDGAFVTRLGPGPSRQVRTFFAGTRTRARAFGRAARLEVQAGVRMAASTGTARVGGPAVVFRGRIADPGAIPAEGKAVELQFRVAGLPWAQFRTVRSDRRGRFRYAYRFSDDDSRGVRFQFRALAGAEPGWPYAAAASRPIFVSGR